MRVPAPLAHALDAEFETWFGRYLTARGLLPSAEDLAGERLLARAVLPHLKRLSDRFTRQTEGEGGGVGRYWKESTAPENLLLAYVLAFLPANLARVAGVWAELARLGFRWSSPGALRVLELGAGPAAGSAGVVLGESFAPVGLPAGGNFALIERERRVLAWGERFLPEFDRHWAERQGREGWVGSVRTFHRGVELAEGFLPPNAPQFNVWLTSFFLNELPGTPAELARALRASWDGHLAEEGLAILVEPGTRQESRKLLEIRRELLAGGLEAAGYRVLLPCLGDQACGALARPDDWCHEEVPWWRPKYYQLLDRLSGMDHKTLPMSYLVIARSRRSREEILPALAGTRADERLRLVGEARKAGPDWEFFGCGGLGKRRVRLSRKSRRLDDFEGGLERGDVLRDLSLRGDAESTRAE